MTAYRVPVVAGSDLDDARLVHADLPALNARDLACEHWQVLGALADETCARHERRWLAERADAIEHERRRRRHGRRAA